MKLATTYLCVQDIKRSRAFYCTLLQQEPQYENEDRWISFSCGNTLSLYNAAYDARLLASNKQDCFNEAYRKAFAKDAGRPKNNLIVLNFEVADIQAEYERLKQADIGPISDLMYVNVHLSYWYFNLIDPDGNTIEIAQC